jgi:hypothetical protein
MLDALDNYAPARAEFEVRLLPIRELRSGMILEEDIVTDVGNLPILKERTVLTQTWIERPGNFARSRGVQKLARVRIPRLAGVG